MSNYAISFSGVSKSYKIYKNRPSTLKEQFINKILKRNRMEIIEHRVLEKASFDIQPGQTVGIIGRNGAGKSTTLKLIANIIPPDEGSIEVNGTVSSLLEIGAGFQPDLTGKENVYLYGTILGLTKKYIENHYDKIVEFSELEDFMETAVKNYSSGMYMRLAFSVAIHVNPDILIIDEVLAVGDANFQKKCFDKIREFKNKGKTIVFVSHDMSSVRDLCDSVVFVDKNGKTTFGETDTLVNLYYTKIYGGEAALNTNDLKDIDILEIDEFKKHVNYEAYNDSNNRWGNQRLVINKVYFSDTQGIVQSVFNTGSDISINIELQSKMKEENVVIGLALYDEKGVHLSGPNSKQDGSIINIIEDTKNLRVILREPALLQGTYYLTVSAYDYECKEPYDYRDKQFKFSIVNNREEYGIVKLNCDWLF
ncbi:ABC transporter ATP-binding protein [Paenibacillus nasutitermitis]|uniref:Sugar ABC transporter ATP-binding protein n=1 Tax=Paenibacillus nasutitermitis TaxID=1652958 RepID=A0A916ZCP3_9BACL|nr:ABC transporter ATP-binding protein [Paenibacillus nasutitermitis]GGD87476.1 sugar ABC transporter ATP-binding protein [Paenibacillus nasutitermitis]